MLRTVVVTLAAALVLLVGGAAAGPLDAPGYAKAMTCSGCHGFAGNSRTEAVPILAGLTPAYFKKAIEDYATGKRVSPEMEPFSKQVKVLGVDDVAAYFATQRREPTPIRAERAAVERGRAAAGQCAACHGPEGQGDPAKLVPAIAGQPELFKADKRSPGDPELTKMKVVLKAIPDAALADVAAYYSSLR
jgi:cytochrome c553